MVLLNIVLRNAKKIDVKYKFLDSIQIQVRGGKGGAGCPKYGGIGGNGGNVTLKVNDGAKLSDVLRQYPRKVVAAEDGRDSKKHCIAGNRGKDKIVLIPPGITVYEGNRHLGDLDKVGGSMLVAKGGLGGRLETGFSSTRGESFDLTLDLKLIADVGLVGFPNAGKSTLLAALSRAKPKIASYPFTTVRPNIGVMELEDGRQISVADLPGLVEGAHRNYGMGHRFLRHVQRTLLLLLVVDIDGFQLSPLHTARSCLQNILLLNKELELYNPDLVYKPCVLLVNKMDKEDSQRTYKEIEDRIHNLAGYNSTVCEEMQSNVVLNFSAVLPISAKHATAEDMDSIKNTIREVIDEHYDAPRLEDEINLQNRCRSQISEQCQIVV
ncbi:GTP-binding protein 10 homolog [Nilaparvata lugens]|uniref:GTP-binding protein 10 homolog n=1 Tax=Nilaparvata lugens TaxID=108931 RepID=UPI00193E74B8|nr:GTP-binding protein 10 homolog [Nilaparvata lugens]